MFYHQKYVFRKKTKYMNVKVFNMTKGKNETKTMEKHISCDCKVKLNSTTYNSNQKWNMKNVNVNAKIIVLAKRLYVES